MTATVVEYRPIYVNGDVSKPGEETYRPSMTVRQAVALAGGYDVVRLRMNNPILESADLKGEYESLWTEYAKEQAHVWRLKKELGQQTALDERSLLDVPISHLTAQEIVKVEAENLKPAKLIDRPNERSCSDGIAEADEQIKILAQQRKAEEDGNQADIEDFERAKELLSRGNLTNLRVTDARRAMLLSSIQKLQTTAQLLQTKRQKDDLAQPARSTRRSTQERYAQGIAGSHGRAQQDPVQAAEHRRKTSIYCPRQVAARTRIGNKPAIAVVRNGDKGVENLVANEEFELQPGDVVEVSLRDDAAVELSSQ